MEFLIMGVATFFNFIILLWKWNRQRYSDLAFDITTLIAISWLFSGTLGGMIVAMISSALISLYLIAFPPNFLKNFQ